MRTSFRRRGGGIRLLRARSGGGMGGWMFDLEVLKDQVGEYDVEVGSLRGYLGEGEGGVRQRG